MGTSLETRVPLWRDPWVLTAFAFTAAWRVAFALAVPTEETPHHRYLAPALEFFRGRPFSAESADQFPGAPLFFAFSMALTGGSPAALAGAQHALGLATWCVAVYVALRAGGDRAARWTAALLSLQLIFPYQERFLFSETTAYFFCAAALAAAVGLRDNPTAGRGRFAVGGWLAAMAGLTRGEFLVLGPVLLAAQALPHKGRSAARLAVYAAAWALTLGAWLAHNHLAGCPGFNPLGASILVDYVIPLVRHDLPTHAAAKAILLEEAAVCGESHRCTPRLRAVERLQALDGGSRGESKFRAQLEVGAIAREVMFTQPLSYAALIWPNFKRGLTPLPWVENERIVSGSAIDRSRARGGWRERFWSWLERGPQNLGWAPLLLSLLAPIGIYLARPKRGVWTAGVTALLAVLLLAGVAPADMSPRLQASVYLPLCLLGGLSADFLSAAFARRRRR